MKTLLALICVATLCTILSLGLWPFHAPNNDVVWLTNQDGLHFGPYGSAISSGTYPPPSQDSSSEVSVEIWFHPRRIWDSGTFLAFYRLGICSNSPCANPKIPLSGNQPERRSTPSRQNCRVLSIDEALHREAGPFSCRSPPVAREPVSTWMAASPRPIRISALRSGPERPFGPR